MFSEIFRFEIKYRLKRPATYIYFALLFLMGFLVINTMGGAFSSATAVMSNKVKVNAPATLSNIMLYLSFPGVLIISALMGNAVYRDFEHRTHSLLFTTPIKKWEYLGGRFLGSLVITLLVLSGIGLGLMAGEIPWPWLQPEKFGPFNFMAYLQPYLLFIWPNILFLGAIFFTLATLTRSVLSTYIGSIIFLVLYSISQSFARDLDNQFLVTLLDPMGYAAMEFTTKYWTVAEQNNSLLPLNLEIALNRALWLSTGLMMLAFCYFRFSFSFFASEGKAAYKPTLEKKSNLAPATRFLLPVVKPVFSFGLSLNQYLRLVNLEFKGIVKSVYFIAILFAGLVALFFFGSQIGKWYDTTTFPVTAQMIKGLISQFGLFQLIIITYYAGELVWRERDNRMNQIYDALPIPNWVPFASKLSALMLVQVVLLALVMVCGIIIQLSKGYFHLEPALYLKGLFGLILPSLLFLCVLAMLIQVIVNNKYLGHFIMIAYYLYTLFQGQMGIEHNLLKFNASPTVIYSDMNGYGHFITPFLLFKIYWGAFAILLALTANLFWIRGTETLMKWRLKVARTQFSRSSGLISTLAILVFLTSGGFIFYNTNVLNKYKPEKEKQKAIADFEKAYKKYDGIPQPRIVAASLNVDIFPEERNIRFKGYFWLKNKTKVAIDSIHVNAFTDLDIRQLGFDRSYKNVWRDEKMGYYIYRLGQPLQPGDSIKLLMDLFYESKGFVNSNPNNHIVHNGSFFNSSYLPSIGYSSNDEISDDETRKEYGLAPKKSMPSVYDTSAYSKNMFSGDSDWIRFEAIVSTVPTQIALAPGYLQKEWTDKGRRYFHYKMDAPILNFYSFLSADYQVKKEKWNDVNLEIYYHKGHEYNLDRMMKGMKASLDYYTRNFGPYQHRQVRILEFPGYSSFAQSFPNTIPFSESIGFIADVDDTDEEDVDYPFKVTAHEVAHQWWGHQAVSAYVQGCQLISETMSQYASLMVMKQTYGNERMKKFLKYEMDRYLSGRAGESQKELPLYKVEGQDYIYYQKGSIVMYALADYLGEDKLNAAIKGYLQEVKFQQAPYTTSLDFLRHIKKATPDSLQYLVKDMFENITLYENKANEPTYTQLKDGRYKVTLTLDAKKYYADSLGNEKEAKMNDFVDVAVFTYKKEKGAAKGKDVPVYFEKKRLKSGQNKLEIFVKEKPSKAGIDPYNKLIDRTPDDNLKAVTKA
ncbi:ABC transporter permease/M1 family aminopeptidase [Adhaeribacter soli]|uniref:ABC transporter permease subunit n=1 Tax=Adhaeribacter soli TaxID=2607655 RepID=A0A5N1J308_9BACT|nr:M1 family aminopeptidase [Adhaeribacter soli]KAA9340969.1 ABC transporter permease subunit [Adhaeribacter soli]